MQNIAKGGVVPLTDNLAVSGPVAFSFREEVPCAGNGS